MSKIDAQKGDLLVEFFSEEIPARLQVGSGEQLENLFVKKLVSREVSFGSCKTYTGPRHLAIIIREIDLVQKDQLVEKRGPRLGSDEKAINGFLKSNNIDFEAILYMNDGLEINQIKDIMDKLSVNPIDLVRTQEKIWKENYKSKKLSNNEITDLLHEFSKLIKRPIFISKTKAIIAIPAEEINKII